VRLPSPYTRNVPFDGASLPEACSRLAAVLEVLSIF
jgi:hypothetical protein